jgi:CLIP-associating protein 1/2
MVRLEGLVKGGAAGFEAFNDVLKQLSSPLVDQLSDRRSAVARQAAHLLEVLAIGMGARFESYMGQFLGPLFKVLPITVQVSKGRAQAVALAHSSRRHGNLS